MTRKLQHIEEKVDVNTGEKIGMMKFGSRLDMYFPKSDVTILARIGDKVRAGETVIGKIQINREMIK